MPDHLAGNDLKANSQESQQVRSSARPPCHRAIWADGYSCGQPILKVVQGVALVAILL